MERERRWIRSVSLRSNQKDWVVNCMMGEDKAWSKTSLLSPGMVESWEVVSGSFYSDMATKMPALMERWCITVCISYALFTNLYKILKFTSDKNENYVLQFSSFQSLSRVRLFVTPWTAACQASLSITNSQSPPKPISIESVMTFKHLILCCPLLLLTSIFPSIREWVSSSHEVAKVLELQLQHQSFQWTPRTDLPWDGLAGSLAAQGTVKSLFQYQIGRASCRERV